MTFKFENYDFDKSTELIILMSYLTNDCSTLKNNQVKKNTNFNNN